MKEPLMPPKLFVKFFRWFCHPRIHDHIEGDLLELYHERRQQLGKRIADLYFVRDVIFLFRPGIIRPAEGYKTLNPYGMYKNFLKVGWRNLLRQKGYSIINISGLAVGMAAAILNGLWIYHELSYNKYFDNYDRIAQVTEVGLNLEEGGHWTGTHMTYPLSHSLMNDYSQHFKRISRTSWDAENIVTVGETKMSAKGLYVDASFPEMFTLKMISGSRTALHNANSIFLSASLAKALFGYDDPINKAININNKTEASIAGVYEDFPDNTKWNGVQFFAPWEMFMANNKWIEDRALNDWRNHFLKIYVELLKPHEFESTASQIRNALKFAPEDEERAKKSEQHLELYPMSKWHLYPTSLRTGQLGPIFLLKLVGIIGTFILLLACINFVNLSTARSERRAREVGIRKTIGSKRSQLIHQFLSESFIIVFVAFLLALLLTWLCLPAFNLIATKNIEMPWSSAWFWLSALVFVLLTGLLAGSWPALYLSSFNPVTVLKGTFRGPRLRGTPRKVLVVFQFCISIILIIGTLVVYQQINYVKKRPVGYDREGLIMMRKKSPDFFGKYDVLRNELKSTGVVTEVSESMGAMTEIASGNNGWDWKGRDPKMDMSFGTLAVSHMHGKTVGWEFVEGRDFDITKAGDSSAVIINESALQKMGLKSPVGEPLAWTWWVDKRVLNYTIIGVVKDMVMESPYAATEPTIFYVKGFNGNPNWINIRVNPQVSLTQALPKIEKVFRKLIPSAPFEYRFADEEYAAKFGKEERMGNIASIFSAIAIFISCLGLFGLASFVSERKTKEIGIRKVFGASVGNVWQMLSKDFVWLSALSCMIASPLAYVMFSSWLKKFTYHMEISWWLFASTTLIAIVITLAIVSYQTVKAALMNPVKSLRSE